MLFTDGRYLREDPAGNWLFRGTADNVGYRDQRYSGVYERPGRFTVSGLWDQIPQFYSVDTMTPYTTTVSPLLLEDMWEWDGSAWTPLVPDGGGARTVATIVTLAYDRRRQEIVAVDSNDETWVWKSSGGLASAAVVLNAGRAAISPTRARMSVGIP